MKTAANKNVSMRICGSALKFLFDVSAGLVTYAFSTANIVIAGFRTEARTGGSVLSYIIPIAVIALMMLIGRLAFKKWTWADRVIIMITAAMGAIIPFFRL